MRKMIYSLWSLNGFMTGFVLVILLSQGVFAQTYSISGKVTDAGGQGVPGVSVQIRSTSEGSITDADGVYKLATSLPAGTYDIDFTSIGYKSVSQKLTLGSQTAITINTTITDEVALLDEVVVTGSTLKSTRRQLGNAINSVNAAELQKAGTGNLFSALQGKVPGAQITQNSGDPAGGMTIRLRGIKSLQGNSDPLYVIDGVIISNSSANVSQYALAEQVGQAVIGTNRMADINPDDI